MIHNPIVTAPQPQAVPRARQLPDIKSVMALFGGALCILFTLALPAFSQVMPDNASAKSYGIGWECDIGFRLNDLICVAVAVPENAYATNRSFGTGWECAHGFNTTLNGTCVAVAVPEGGFLEPSGTGWKCLRGFSKVSETCQKFVVPTHAYLTDTTHSPAWECERGYEAQGDRCAAIIIPANAYLNNAGYGKPWTCARGYAISGQNCNAIELPKHAHLDRSGNRWACDKNFQKSKGQCVLRN